MTALHTRAPEQKSASISGILIRSQVVASRPGLQLEASDQAGTDLTVLRQSVLSPNVLLCLFDGELATLRIRTPPMLQHFEIVESLQRPGTADRLFDLDQLDNQTSSASLVHELIRGG